jgi:hypothetical protein
LILILLFQLLICFLSVKLRIVQCKQLSNH